MGNTSNGYVIVRGTGKDELIILDSFDLYKGDCIKRFEKGSGHTWRYWYRKYNFRCVKATREIKLS